MIEPNVWYTIFPRLLNMSITASVVIVFVVIARFFLRKTPRIFSYVLWSVVLFRLVCPFSFTTPFSLLRLTSPKSVENKTVVYVPEDIVHMEEPEVSVPVPVVGETHSESINKTLPKGSEQTGADPLEIMVSVMTYAWIFGVLVMAGYSIVSVIKMKKRLVGAVKLKDNIWIADHVHTLFVMGIFRPRIYLWSGLSQKEQEFVIMHEKIHIKRCDHLVKIFFWLVLTLHWFNPLVWLSYILCMQDMEMSCDESVMRNMKEDVRADYSESLLSLATGKKIFAGSLLFFGEGNIKSRIKNVLNYKKPTVWVIAAGIVIVAVLGICFMGNPAVDSDNLENSISKEEREEEWKKYLEQKVAEVNDWVYPQYPVYVRTIGNASIGCEYGYCAKEDRNDADILEDLSRMNGFYFSNNYSEDVALFYSEEPQEIKLYHVMEGNENYEEYAFAGEDYEYPYGAEREKYVIQVPEEYGMHYFFAVISWEDGSEDLLYFSMEYKYNPPSDADYNQIQITENETGTYFTE